MFSFSCFLFHRKQSALLICFLLYSSFFLSFVVNATITMPDFIQENSPINSVETNIEPIDSRIATRFEKLASHKHGVGSQLPIDVRLRRKGPIEQTVSLSKEGILTIIIHFSLEQNLTQENVDLFDAPSLIPCSMNRSFHLKNFKDGGRYRYEMNRALNSIVLYDGLQSHHLAFSSRSNFEEATTLFSILIEQSHRFHKERKMVSQQDPENKILSKIIEKAGFQWIALVPRNEHIEASCSAFNGKNHAQFQEMMIWLTKVPFSIENRQRDAKILLEESRNLSPIFLFPLNCLDGWEFSTLPFVGAPFEQLYTTPIQEQSISSKEKISFLRLASSQSSLPIRLTRPAPPLHSPSFIVCRNRDEKQVKKGVRQIESQEDHSCSIITTTPQFFEEDIPEGTCLRWLMGISPQSDDHLRSLFFNPPSSKKELLAHIYREYPSLERILMQQSAIRKKMNIQDSLLKTISELQAPPLLSKIAERGSFSCYNEFAFRRISFSTLLALETGAFFGSLENFRQNGVQFAITLEEKLGAPWSERIALEHFFLNPLLNNREGRVQWLEDYVSRKKIANMAQITLQEWLITEYIALNAITTALKKNPEIQKKYEEYISFIQAIPKSFLDGTCSIPIGFTTIKMERARPLFGAYLWEKMDAPLHRDGLSLSRIRTKYEEHILKNPKSHWRNKFWQWIAHKQEKKEIKVLSPSTYISGNERDKYKAKFQNGLLIAPKELIRQEEEELIFVVDLYGTLYLWKKYDSRSFTTLSFNHASFFSGNPVASSGKMVVRGGKIALVTDHSGHYRPKRKDMLVILTTLQKLGVNIADIAVLHSASATKTKLWKSGETFLEENDWEKKRDSKLITIEKSI